VEARRASSIWDLARLIRCPLGAWACLGCACSADDRTEDPLGAGTSTRSELRPPWLLTGPWTPAAGPVGKGGDMLLLAGSEAVILRSSDGERTFVPAETPGAEALFDLAAGGIARIGVAVGAEGTIFYSPDFRPHRPTWDDGLDRSPVPHALRNLDGAIPVQSARPVIPTAETKGRGGDDRPHIGAEPPVRSPSEHPVVGRPPTFRSRPAWTARDPRGSPESLRPELRQPLTRLLHQTIQAISGCLIYGRAIDTE